MWLVVTILDSVGRSWIVGRSEGEGLGWLEDAGDRDLAGHLPVQEYFMF